ncbi:hypothetical protein GETHLI_26480 [Geothrix limicola]|uniref:Tip attachment protein J domain-containing protein n=1 Tax=Geothrix limicola TaxID=2927978 RepID=A0ABQ5QHX0_9BACT|nr:DUF6519 domain-containing protein [Geothrix limicola]GLH74146.1 hypothetical protein GETHLI_26480 [Geothrix limicola]
MKGDFSRVTFDPTEHYTRVLLQQGRVSLDADFNEQAAILLHRLQVMTADLVGEGAGPTNNLGFTISASATSGDFGIGKGRYYVNGILVENDADCSFLAQPDYPVPTAKLLTGVTGNFLAYLDVWERHVTALEEPEIREVALGGPDTATRAEVVWQVKLYPLPGVATNTGKNAASTALPSLQPDAMKVLFTKAASQDTTAKAGSPAAFALSQDLPIPLSYATLRARAKQNPPDTDPCAIPPASSYRGLENQLYRVEVHNGGQLSDKPTFKWSRENGSVTFPILKITADTTNATTTLSLANLGRDQKLGLAVGDWVEIVDDTYVLQNLAEPLLQVTSISLDDLSVTVSGLRATANRGDDPTQHPLLRRWDQPGSATDLTNGAVPITLGSATVDTDWIGLEDGVQILFEALAQTNGLAFFRTGDYWLIPARVATGDVEWPQSAGTASALPPRGVEHQYAALARISVASGTVSVTKDLRRSFDVISKPMP